MKADAYTKIVPTIIAACLVWLSIGGTSAVTHAQDSRDPQRVYIAGWIGPDGKPTQDPLRVDIAGWTDAVGKRSAFSGVSARGTGVPVLVVNK